jgi:lipoprotein-releasing system permease protein
MYKLLLCWRYLRTRYIALASIISVTLGVATMIVVNSVMAGFNREMQDRIHGILSDVVIESPSMNGFHDPEWHMKEIRRVCGDTISGMTPTVIVPAMLSFHVGGQWVTRQVNFIGVEAETHAEVSDFGRFLQHPDNRQHLSFDLREDRYDQQDHQAGREARQRPQMEFAGWQHRRMMAERQKAYQDAVLPQQPPVEPFPEQSPGDSGSGDAGTTDPDAASPTSIDTDSADPGNAEPATGDATAADPAAIASSDSDASGADPAATGAPQPPAESDDDARPAPTHVADDEPSPSADPFRIHQHVEDVFDAAKEQHTGIVLGIALASFRGRDGEDRFLVLPGDDVKITIPTAGQPPKAVSETFTIVDFYESKMSEYDSGFVFVPLKKLQQLRGMINPSTGVGNVTSIQIRLKPGVDGDEICRKLRAAFPPELYGVQTWRDKQGPLLSAVQMETAILNVLLFMIIAVAGFGILAIFYMIVVEKTRDIGILKSLGASGGGIMGIFLAYGLSLGMVGSGAGLIAGLLFVVNINTIADWLGKITGQQVFSPEIYYFQRIPTLVDPFTVSWIVTGAMLIAVVASILPARRAARLHPVEALRYE